MPRLLNQISNSLLWLDEFHNTLNKDILGIMQRIYDGGGYEKADFTNGIETKSVEIKSAVALTSNFYPEDEIFFSRCELMNMNKPTKERSREQKNAYRELEFLEKNGLSCVLVELLQHSKLVLEHFKNEFQNLYNSFCNFSKVQLDNRMIKNICSILTVPYILLKYHKIKFSEELNFHLITN